MTQQDWDRMVLGLEGALKRVLEGVAWPTYTHVDEPLIFNGRALGTGRLLSVYGGSWEILSLQLARLTDGSLWGWNLQTSRMTVFPITIDVPAVERWVARQLCLGMDASALSEWEGLLEAA